MRKVKVRDFGGMRVSLLFKEREERIRVEMLRYYEAELSQVEREVYESPLKSY